MRILKTKKKWLILIAFFSVIGLIFSRAGLTKSLASSPQPQVMPIEGDPFTPLKTSRFIYKAKEFELAATVPSYISVSTPDSKKPAAIDLYLKKNEPSLESHVGADVEAGIKIKLPEGSPYFFIDIDLRILKFMPDIFRWEWPISGISTAITTLESGDIGVYAIAVPVKEAKVNLEVLPVGEWKHIGSYNLYVVEEPKFIALGIPAESITVGEVEPIVVPPNICTERYLPRDVNMDGIVDVYDLVLVGRHFNQKSEDHYVIEEW